jgi:hypothetical protein
MTDCTCSGEQTKSIDEEIVETEDVEIAAGLDEPVEVDKEEAVLKDMEATLMKLKEVINYLSEKEEEKMDHEEKMDEEKAEHEDEEEEDEEEEEEEEEEKMMDDKKPKKKDDIDDLYKAVTTLKKHGIGVYTGQKATPAPTTEAPKEEKAIDWMNVTKSWAELEEGGN